MGDSRTLAPRGGDGGGAGGGSAYGLGPATNTFADATARDAYAGANNDWLTQYNNNRFFWIRTGTNIQRRNAAGNGWENVTAVVQGAQGVPGSYERTIFRAFSTAPTSSDTPTAPNSIASVGAAPTLPAGTAATPPSGDTPIYASLQRVARGSTTVTYTAWRRWDGVDGGDGEGGMAATWDRRLAPSLPIDGVRPTGRGQTLQTGGSFTTNGSARERFIQLSVPDHLRQFVRDGRVGLALRFAYRVRSVTSTTPVRLRFRLLDGTSSSSNYHDTGNQSHAMNSEGAFDGVQVLSLPRGSQIEASGDLFIRCTFVSSPGGNTVTVDRMSVDVALLDEGLKTVGTGDLDGMPDPPTAGHILAIATDTGEFQILDPATLGGDFDIWEDLATRNTIADTDRIPIAWSQGNGQPNRAISFENLRYALQQPIITQFDVTGDQRVAAGTNISGRTYRYALEISQPGHVADARIVGFPTANGDPISPQSPADRVALATIPDDQFAHSSGEITIPSNTTLANAGDLYTLRLEVYVTGQTVGTDRPFAYHDFHVVAQADSGRTHFFHVTSTEAAADWDTPADDILTRHGVAGNYLVAGIPDSGLHRLGWAVPASDAQPARWEQGGTDITPTIEAAVDQTRNSVDYKVYLLAAANAVSDAYNGQTIVVTT